MGAYNSRLMPRLIFGLPLNAVAFSAIAFVLLVVALLPSTKLHPLRPFLIFAFGLLAMRTYYIMRTATESAIVPAMDKNKRITRAKRPTD